MKKLLFIIVTILLVQGTNAQTDSLYFGQTTPGDSAVVFAPGIVSLTNREDFKIVFSPNGDECFFETYTSGADNSIIYYTKRINGQWTEPQAAPFTINPNSSLDFISADGNKLYFSININDNYDYLILSHNSFTAKSAIGFKFTISSSLYFISKSK